MTQSFESFLRQYEEANTAFVNGTLRCCFRKEDGDWKIVHRYADPLERKSPPPSD